MMKSKTLALTNGIVGLAGGILMLFGPFFITGAALSDVASSTGASQTTGLAAFLTIVKIAILVLGIIGAVYYRGTDYTGTAPHVLLIVGGAVALVPFLGWAGGIVAIVGGSLYLAKLKNFKADHSDQAA